MAASMHVPPSYKHTRLFRLVEPLQPRGSAKAEILNHVGTEWTPSGETFTVCDTLNISGDAGCLGRAMNLFGCWYVTEISCE